jgi:hypothetical protein
MLATPANTQAPIVQAHGAPVPGTELPIPNGYTQQTFAEAILTRMGAPITQLNVSDIMSWEAAEGGNWGNSAKYNPLNTTRGGYASSAINSAGVQAYKNWGDGINATLDTLNLPAYKSISEALINGGSQDFGTIVAASPWGTNPFAVNVAPHLPVVNIGSAGGKTTVGNWASDVGQGIGAVGGAAEDVALAPAKLADFVVKDWWIILLVIFALVVIAAIIIKKLSASPTVQEIAKSAPIALAA